MHSTKVDATTRKMELNHSGGHKSYMYTFSSYICLKTKFRTAKWKPHAPSFCEMGIGNEKCDSGKDVAPFWIPVWTRVVFSLRFDLSLETRALKICFQNIKLILTAHNFINIPGCLVRVKLENLEQMYTSAYTLHTNSISFYHLVFAYHGQITSCLF